MKHNLIVTLSLLGASTVAFSANANSGSAQSFVSKVSISDEFEIESSKLALEKSQNAEVKQFAQNMINDHSKTSDKLSKTLKASNSEAKPADKLDDKHQKMLAKLESVSGTSFDQKYIVMQTDAHKEAVNLFSDYSKTGNDTALKTFAADTLPALQGHLEHVQKLSRNN